MCIEIINGEEANKVNRAKQEKSASQIFNFITDIWNEPGGCGNKYW